MEPRKIRALTHAIMAWVGARHRHNDDDDVIIYVKKLISDYVLLALYNVETLFFFQMTRSVASCLFPISHQRHGQTDRHCQTGRRADDMQSQYRALHYSIAR